MDRADTHGDAAAAVELIDLCGGDDDDDHDGDEKTQQQGQQQGQQAEEEDQLQLALRCAIRLTLVTLVYATHTHGDPAAAAAFEPPAPTHPDGAMHRRGEPLTGLSGDRCVCAYVQAVHGVCGGGTTATTSAGGAGAPRAPSGGQWRQTQGG